MKMIAASASQISSPASEEAASVLSAELDAFLGLLRTLETGDWPKPSDCPGWMVHDVVAHVVGQWSGAARLRVLLRYRRVGHRRYPDRSRLAAFTQQQVDELGRRSPTELIELFAKVGPKALRSARRVPKAMRRLDVSRLFPEDPVSDPRLGYFLDVIAARDTWMHRVDICQATNRSMVLGAHDRQIVEQVIRDLGRAWTGPSVVLDLTGPAGGCWSLGEGPPLATVRVDTVGYMRTLSGRGGEPNLDVDGDPGAATAITTARVVF
jgi:uncharacterized protein (TIGR03083 family)